MNYLAQYLFTLKVLRGALSSARNEAHSNLSRTQLSGRVNRDRVPKEADTEASEAAGKRDLFYLGNHFEAREFMMTSKSNLFDCLAMVGWRMTVSQILGSRPILELGYQQNLAA